MAVVALADPATEVIEGPSAEGARAGTASLDKLKRYFAESAYKTKEARQNSLTCLDYYDSDQFTSAERKVLADRKQPDITINRIKPAVNGIIGVVERGRSDPKAWPRNPGQEDAADAATDVLRFVADCQPLPSASSAIVFLDMLVPGIMAALVGVDGDKQVTITQIRWEEFFYDPQSRRADFKDGRYLGVCKWMYADPTDDNLDDQVAAALGLKAMLEGGAAGAETPAATPVPVPGATG